ncbi:hypothetical protein [Rhabdothermincola sediminis]|uniref:hypothetical protein n=1 Tax=Rhabdothermincola sediminis TaxID=2751370 RepID=UPI001AA08F30|nr:hypothetical protein [Rhabdothermincola sediminis]
MAVEVFVYQDHVTVDFTGTERILTLKGHLDLSMYEIESARVAPVDELRAELGWRVGGGYLPGFFITGWFTVPGRKGARQLWCVYRDREALVIETRRDSPRRVVLQHPYRHDLAWLIAERVPHYS